MLAHPELLQNKILPLRYQKSYSHSNHYRSIVYKVNCASTIQPKSIQKIQRRQNYLNKQKHSLSKETYRFSTGKANLKKYHTIQNQQSETRQKKMSYLQTWRTMLQKIQLKGMDCSIEAKKESYALPSLRQYQSSMFTPLDPILLPIHFIKNQIKIIASQLSDSSLEVARIKASMEQIKKNQLSQLEKSFISVENGISKLKQMLILDSVRQQQVKMRFKRQCKTIQMKSIVENIQKSKQEIGKLQLTIFDSKPFQLGSRQENIPQQLRLQFY